MPIDALSRTNLMWRSTTLPTAPACPGPGSRVWGVCAVPAGLYRGQDRHDCRLAVPRLRVRLTLSSRCRRFRPSRSLGFLVGGSKAEALRRANAIKKRFAGYRVDARSREWFDGAVTDDVLAAAASFDDEQHLIAQTLREALEIQATAGLESPRSPALTATIASRQNTLQ